MAKDFEKLLVGSLETCDLPKLGITHLHMRVDTGAKTSSLHVDNIEEFERDGKAWITFDIHPDIHHVEQVVRREARIKSRRRIKSSNATQQRRYVVETTLSMGGYSWPIELTLTDRSEMSYLMLLGRQGMKGRLIVDPELKYCLGEPERPARKAAHKTKTKRKVKKVKKKASGSSQSSD